MTRYPLAPLLYLALAAVLSACAAGARGGTGTAVGQQEGQQQNNVISSTATMNGANFGLNIGAGAIVVPTLDYNATQAALVSQIATANANTALLRESLNAQNVAMHQIDLDIEKAKERTAVLVASGKASEAEIAKAKAEEQRLILAQIVAKQKLAEAEAELAKAHAAEAEANSKKISADITIMFDVTVVAVTVAMVILLMHLLARYPVQVPVQEIEGDNYFEIDRIDNRPVGTQQYPGVMQSGIPPHIATAEQLEIVANVYGRDGYPLSHANFTPKALGFSEGEWKRFQDYLVLHTDYAHWQDPADHRSGLNIVDGFKQYLKRFETLAPRPTLEPTHADSIQPTQKQTDTQVDSQNDGGGGVEDPFGILPYGEGFLPQEPTYHAGLQPQKDETK